MSEFIPFVAGAGPFLLAVVAAFAQAASRRKDQALRAARLAVWLNLVLAGLAALGLILFGPAQSGVLGVNGFGLAVRVDAISAVIFALVAFVGVVVVEYSRNYLAGDRRQAVFAGEICLALAAVSTLVLAGNVAQLMLGWVGASLAVHRLMVFYHERPAAVLAARKKFVVARIGDLCLATALVILVRAFDTADLERMLQAAQDHAARGETPHLVNLAAVLLAVAALLKSAQFPTHGWLLGVMEAPTPVSALLHAGIINAGGFLIIRMADVVVLSAPSMYVLAIIGGTTALVGSLVMLTQTSAKASLAWSTVAQMGFMLFQCGLGAFSMAMLHIVAHSLYKAHAFLSAGSAAVSGNVPAYTGHARWPVVGLFAVVMAGLALMTAGVVLFDLPLLDKPSFLILEVIFLLGLAHLLTRAANERGILRRAALAATGLGGAYIALQALASFALSSALPEVPKPTPGTLIILGVALVAFPVALFAQWIAPQRANDIRWQSAYVHLRNGFYANAMSDRLMNGFSTKNNRKEVL